MPNRALLKISGAFGALSAFFLLCTIALGISVGGNGPAPIEFGSAVVLTELASNTSALLLSSLALISPILALGAALGWRELASSQRQLATVGVLLWYFGMVFVVLQDAMEVALVHDLPRRLTEGSDPGFTLAVGGIMSTVVAVFTLVGDLVSFGGLILLGAALAREKSGKRWLGWLGLGSGVLTCIGILVPALLPFRLLGFVLFAGWLVWSSTLMLRSPQGEPN